MPLRHTATALAALLVAACGSAPPPVPDAPAVTASAPALTVTASETTLTSPDGEGVLRLPVVSGGADGVAASINAYLAPEALLGASIDSVRAEYAECTCGTVGADYTVTWSRAPVLGIAVDIETMAAYPSGWRVALAFDTETGAVIGVHDLLTPSRQAELAAILDARLQSALAESVARADEVGAPEAKELLVGRFTVEDLAGFSVGEAGVAFDWTAGLPHVIRALEPAGPFEVSWAEMAPFLTPRYATLATR